MRSHHFSRPRIGIEHGDSAFRRGMTAALGTYDCRSWGPRAESPGLLGLDIAIVERTERAAKILRASPAVALLCWGRPDRSPDGWTWDGWISRSLGAPDAAGVLLELIASGLLARNHGPEPYPRQIISK
ncbi:MAG: hypothetical protein ACQEVA_16450 [Myxococcota bacterium]